ncbi:CPBP family intramembrane glutamic endopeptidase [Deinococcus aestuarii]|uniref:CPBP family intramembrane glutamic endopeptidase n=1 Tax=Deinococcus aestuarii TaxID=2774531 RepID=UPI001C0D2DFF|nr:CPBP family intramembrane glutamic endopeptidase [Deinococcus aestuarii]
MTTARPAPAFLPAFARLAAVGLVGLLGLYPTLLDLFGRVARGEGPLPSLPGDLSPALLAALSLIQPGVLILGSVALGVLLAPRVGLRSVVAGLSDRPFTRGDGVAGLLVGAVTGVGLVGLDALTRPLLGAAGATLSLGRPRSLLETLTGVLYGGLAEELLLRWGVMTLLAWLGWRVLWGGRGAPGAGVMWGAVIVSALLFGLGHLGAAGLATELTPAVVARTVLLNAVVGVAFGWLYWRRNLETAMLAHAGWHVTVTLVSWLV